MPEVTYLFLLTFYVFIGLRTSKSLSEGEFDKCESVCISLLFFILNWYVFDHLVEKWYLIDCYIDLRVMVKHKEDEGGK